MSQNEALKNYLDAHRSITRMESFTELGITNLWQRISEIERDYPIRREEVTVPDRRGKLCHVTRYWKAKIAAQARVTSDSAIVSPAAASPPDKLVRYDYQDAKGVWRSYGVTISGGLSG